MTGDEERKLTVMLVEMSTKRETLLDKQEELAENISTNKEAVYNPDSGLYARLKELDIRIIQLENWKSANTRFMWIVGGSVSGLLIQTIWTTLFP